MEKVIVNSLPKSGTHLVAHCLNLFGFKRSHHIGSGMVIRNDAKKLIRRIMSLPISHGHIVGVDTPTEVSKRLVNRRLNSTLNGEYITAHIGYTDNILTSALNQDFKPILVTRDPRAVINSFVHYVLKEKKHILHNKFKNHSQTERYKIALEGYADGRIFLQSMKARCLAIEVWRTHRNVLSIKFEDLIGSKGGGDDAKQNNMLIEICQFVGANKSDIENVSNNLFGSEGMTFRKGRTDSWKQEIPEIILPTINGELSSILEEWGYEI
jgi:hypothetical protein